MFGSPETCGSQRVKEFSCTRSVPLGTSIKNFLVEFLFIANLQAFLILLTNEEQLKTSLGV